MKKANRKPKLDALCDVPGLRIGHAQNDEARTGCTVIWPENGAVAGVDVRGSAPGTREIELLRPVRLVQHIHALLLTGGSAFGLDAAGGVQQFLEERNIGFDVGVAKVPIVPAAVIFDLAVGDAKIRPDREMGYRAAQNASTDDVSNGMVGAGAGSTVGKSAGLEHAMPGGLGQASEQVGNTIVVAALVVVNAFGDVIGKNGEILAGARADDGTYFDSMALLRQMASGEQGFAGNTTLAVVATNAALSKEACTKVAQMAHDGLARAINPIHTMYDGDIAFALSCGDEPADNNVIGAVGAELVARAVRKAVRGK